RYSAAICGSAFFPPGLDPVLDCGVGNEHAMVAPEMPTGRSIGQSILHHQPHGQTDDTVRIMTTRRSQIRNIGVERPAAFRADMLRVHKMNISRSSGNKIAHVMQGPTNLSVPIGAVTAIRTGTSLEVSA